MKTIGKFTKTIVAVAITGALVAPASAAFAGEKTERAIIGALIGGLAGAAIGDGKTDAVAIGAVAGAALGATTAKDKYDRRYSQSYRTAPRYASNGYGDGRYAYDRDGRRYDRYDARYDRRDDNRYAYGYRR
jgi:uncharacterized protein YcfJ